MDQERRTQIEAALQQYRETVLQHSLFLLHKLVEGVEAEPTPPGLPEENADFLRVREIGRHLQGISKFIKSPRAVLNDDFLSSLIEPARLDGVSHYPVNLALRERYFAGVRTHIEALNVEVAEFPPADLDYLCTLISGVTGPGLPFHREVRQFDFITPIEDENLEEMMAAVEVPIRDGGEDYNNLTFIWEDWEIIVAFKLGGGPRGWGGSWALYCRKEDNDEWKWRYGLHDEDWCSDVYNSVGEFLGFYAHFREQTEEELRKHIRGIEKLR